MAEQKKKPAKRADRPKPEFDPALCVGCAMCVESCPMNCVDLMMPEGKEAIHEVAILEKKNACIGCGICRDVCPADAVQMVASDGTVVTEKESGKEVKNMANKAYVGFCRAFQAVMKVGLAFLPLPVPQTLKGEGALTKLPALIRKKGISNVLVITDPGLMKLGLPDPLFKALKEAGISYSVYADVEPNPTNENVEQAFQIYRDNGCQGIISMGGGSPMDCGKVVGAKAENNGKAVEFRAKNVVLTGVSFEPGLLGTAVSDGKEVRYDFNPRLARTSHGTGDVFASVFAGAAMRGLPAPEASALAADVVCAAIEATPDDHWYGVAFERVIPLLVERLG